jgi:hypothetical protein
MGLPCAILGMKRGPTMQQATRPSTEDSAKEIEAMARAAALLLDVGDLKSSESVGRLLLAIEQRAAELARSASA